MSKAKVSKEQSKEKRYTRLNSILPRASDGSWAYGTVADMASSSPNAKLLGLIPSSAAGLALQRRSEPLAVLLACNYVLCRMKTNQN